MNNDINYLDAIDFWANPNKFKLDAPAKYKDLEKYFEDENNKKRFFQYSSSSGLSYGYDIDKMVDNLSRDAENFFSVKIQEIKYNWSLDIAIPKAEWTNLKVIDIIYENKKVESNVNEFARGSSDSDKIGYGTFEIEGKVVGYELIAMDNETIRFKITSIS